MGRGLITVVVLAWTCCWTVAWAQDLRPELPQFKIDRVDAMDPGDWRAHVTALDEDGLPMDLLEHQVTLYLSPGKESLRPAGSEPFVRFDAGLAAPGFDGEMSSARKSEAPQAVVLVVAAHAGVSHHVGAVLTEGLSVILGGLKEDARVGMIFYGDLVSVLWSPDGVRTELRDVNDHQHCLGRLQRAAAGMDGEGDAPEGEVPCADLFSSPSMVTAGLSSLPAGQGLCPRFFGIPESPELMEAARKRGHTPLDRRSGESERESFATGALETAVRLLATSTPSSAVREIVLVSDGLDGYLRVADLVSQRASRNPVCLEREKRCGRKAGGAGHDHEGGSGVCTREVLECAIPRVAAALGTREEVVRDYLTGLIGLARTAGVRVSSLVLPGTGEVGRARLRILSLKTGGTWRASPTLGEFVEGAATPLADELATQVVIVPDDGLEPDTDYVLALTVDDRLASRSFRFRSGSFVGFWDGPFGTARAFFISRLGHGWGPVILWVVTVLVALLVLLAAWKLGKGIVGLAKKIGGGKAKVKAPQRPRVPTLKRPGWRKG
ncbi:MAG: hypothetical protein ISR64_06675 [Deltaproteobacteria bacterium]|nr:hypothetical protein [Deltaproteobacteria bacterium]